MGIKFFVLCDSNGYAYRFEIYHGAGDNLIIPGTPDLGASSNVVIGLSQTIPNFRHHILYFKNFYTSLPLLIYLRARGIYSLGTVRANRIPNCKLPLDTDIAKEKRGYSIEYVGCSQGVDITTVLWNDNKPVRLMSSYVGIEPFARTNPNISQAKAPRYVRKEKTFVEVDVPQIIKEYNRRMGGVDSMDSIMGRYHIRAKTRDAMTRLFYHLVDMAATNAYFLYRRIQAERSNDSSDIDIGEEKLMDLPDFRDEIAAGLCACQDKRTVGRPSLVTNASQPSTSQIGRRAQHPVQDVRYDKIDHFTTWVSADKKESVNFAKSHKLSPSV
ncbi:piggyBac transposable element-derived protein 1-like [Diabrotica virgifera virgifera]|uniref:PiggyBac transposable element-derived protein domain-containing protein n=1 Tax=Diabrotica virgifera virgifera TaxID=50390 RepID=A0ABM5JYM5_DIAVI|nr:piggyBac transposable element-derived protein 1-like [Diabrotica virgifera virgifera]